MAKTLQEELIGQLLDPRSSLTPRENAAAAEILWLRSRVNGIRESWNVVPVEKAEPEPGKAEVKKKV